MAAAAGSVFAFFVLLSVVGALALYYLVRREAQNTERMTREEAHERASREQDEN